LQQEFGRPPNEAAQKKIEGETKMKLKNSRGIVTKLICCMALVVSTSAFASQNPPTSGALLTIHGTGTSSGIDLKLYDSQIHSGSVQTVPVDGTNGTACLSTSGDNIPTDAYVLQGGAATGCDPNDPFEVTDDNTALTHQASGLKPAAKFSGFKVETHYLSVPVVSISGATDNLDGTTTYSYTRLRGKDILANENIAIGGFTDFANNNGNFTIQSVVPNTSFTVGNNGVPATNDSGQNATGTASGPSAAVCNTSGTICANPDSGFLTVTNNTGSDFNGTIALNGTSTGCGAASDSADFSTSALANGTAVILGVGTPGTPALVDSSNCGGFNQAQLLSLTANQTSFAFFGGGPPAGGLCAAPCKDDYQFTPLNSASGDTFSILPVPVPAGPLGSGTFGPFPTGCVGSGCTFQSGEFGSESPIDASPLRFSASNFPTLACVPYADFSAPGNPVCVELHEDCKNGANPCADAGNILYTVQNDYSIDANSLPNGIGGPAFLGQHFVSCPNTGFDLNIVSSYTAPSVTFDPLKGSGSGTTSCWVAAFDPNAAAVTTGSTVTTFTGFSGLLAPPSLNRVNIGSAVPLNFTFPTAGLHLCSTVNNTGSTCNGGAQKPWVAFGTLSIDCTTKAFAPTSSEKTAAAGGSNLQTISTSTTPPLTSYRFNWKIPKTPAPSGCVVMVAQFSGGLVVFPDFFQYK
jgi:hypothetical protein